jgi:hypothetical protein
MSLKVKVSQFEHFFAQEPTLLYKQTFGHSPTGVLYYYIRATLKKIAFDVQQSGSLVSPYIGYIYLTYEQPNNQSCGDQASEFRSSGRMVHGFSTYEKAREYANTCFQPSKYPPEEVRIAFAFQDGQWVYKDVIRVQHNNVDLALAAAFGYPVSPGLRVDDNRAWEQLVAK